MTRAVGHTRCLRVGLAALAVFLVGASSCFGPPVVEKLEIELLPGGKGRVSARVELAGGRVDNPRVAARLASWRDEIAAGVDPWSRRFAELEPEEERIVWERKDGQLVAAERSARIDDLSRLERLFADTPVALRFDRQPSIGELTFVTGGGSRASRAERREIEQRVTQWLDAVASYLADIDALRREAAGSPQRERLLFGLFLDQVDEAEAGEISAQEHTILERLDKSTAAIAEALSVAEGEADTLDERSRLVFDPFPAPVAIMVRGRILESEGFERRPDGSLALVAPGLFAALGRLAPRWPALDAFVQALRDEAEGRENEIDLDAFVAAVATGAPAPDRDELRRAFARELEPAPLYRVRWAFAP